MLIGVGVFSMRLCFIADIDLRQGHPGRELHTHLRDQCDVTLHAGDFTYFELERGELSIPKHLHASKWIQTIDDTMGLTHPLYACPGNHDADAGVLYTPNDGYAAMLTNRMQRTGQLESCTRHTLKNQVCTVSSSSQYTKSRAPIIIMSSMGVDQTPLKEHHEFIEKSLHTYAGQSRWRICMWHSPSFLFNTGEMPRHDHDNVQDDPYFHCVAHGAIIFNGHDHAYCRTKSINITSYTQTHADIQVHGAPYHYPAQQIDATLMRDELLVLASGSAFSFVNGLGGLDMRGSRAQKALFTHWSTVVNADAHGGWQAGNKETTAFMQCHIGVTPSYATTLDQLVAIYQLPSLISSRVDDFREQIAFCRLINLNQHTLDSFYVLNVNTIQPLPESLATATSTASSTHNLQNSEVDINQHNVSIGADVNTTGQDFTLPIDFQQPTVSFNMIMISSSIIVVLLALVWWLIKKCRPSPQKRN